MSAPAKPIISIDRKKLKPPKGRRPVLQNCTIAELSVDPAYQRSIANGPSRALIARIARHWDWSLCQPLVVAQRPDGGLYVVDGQHRHAAAVLRGDILDLPCVVLPFASAAEEAAQFVALNQARRPLSAIDLFNAALTSGDKDAMSVMLLIEGAGLSLATCNNIKSWRPGQISNISGVQRCYKAEGADLTRRALKALSDGFAGQVLRYGGTLFAGIAGALAEIGDAIDMSLLVLVLGGASQADWIRDIAAIEAEQGIHRRVAATQAIRAAYEEALAAELEDAA